MPRGLEGRSAVVVLRAFLFCLTSPCNMPNIHQKKGEYMNKKKEIDPGEKDKVEVRFFMRRDLYERMKEVVRPYGGSVVDFVRRACLHELERQ